jgi:glycosyltransferase involved in cell wall biosynthesis
MIKVVFLNQYTLYNRNVPLYDVGTDVFYSFGMGEFIADEFFKRNYDVTFETWRMDLRIAEVMEKRINNLTCRVFPSRLINKFGEYSKELVHALKTEAENPAVVFHFMSNHSLHFHCYALLVRKRTIVATHLGGSNPLWKYQKYKKFVSLVYFWLERYLFLKSYNHFITMSSAEAEYFRKLNISVVHTPIFGISKAEMFIIKDRQSCRERLGLPLDKKILLQVGRAESARGFDWIIELLDHFKKDPAYHLVFVGIHKEDEYYPELASRCNSIIDYLHHTDLVDYYNAADLLYYLPHGELDLAFAGTSFVPIEALACGTPVVATTFHHFPGNEVHEVSRIPKTKEQIIPMFEELLAANVPRHRCREIALKYFSWDEVVKIHWDLYNN